MVSAQISIFDISAGRHARDAGIARIIDTNATFVETARGIARLLARRIGVVCMDDVRKVLNDYGITPKHQNAFGAVFKGDEWVAVGWKQSEIPSNHGRPVRSWKLKDKV